MERIKAILKKIRLSLFKGAFVHNPILTQAAGVFAIIVAAKSLSGGFALALTAGIILLVNEAAAGILLKRLPRWLRVAFYTLISGAVIYLAEPLIIPLTSGGRALPLGFCLLSVNALTVIRCERFACKNKLRHCIVDAFSGAIGYGAVAVVTGAARELIVYGTFFRGADSVPLIPNGALPFIAFAVLGFLAAFQKAIVIKFYPKEQTNTFSMKSSDEKISLCETGLGNKRKPSETDNSDDYDIIDLRPAVRDIQEGEGE